MHVFFSFFSFFILLCGFQGCVRIAELYFSSFEVSRFRGLSGHCSTYLFLYIKVILIRRSSCKLYRTNFDFRFKLEHALQKKLKHQSIVLIRKATGNKVENRISSRKSRCTTNLVHCPSRKFYRVRNISLVSS